MRKPSLIDIISVILVTFAIVSCNPVSNSEGKVKTLPDEEKGFNQKESVLNDNNPTTNTPISNELSFLKAFNEKYPYEIKLLEEPIIKKRLEKMLGPQYAFVKSIWEVETPITIVDGMFYDDVRCHHWITSSRTKASFGSRRGSRMESKQML